MSNLRGWTRWFFPCPRTLSYNPSASRVCSPSRCAPSPRQTYPACQRALRTSRRTWGEQWQTQLRPQPRAPNTHPVEDLYPSSCCLFLVSLICSCLISSLNLSMSRTPVSLAPPHLCCSSDMVLTKSGSVSQSSSSSPSWCLGTIAGISLQFRGGLVTCYQLLTGSLTQQWLV